MFTARQAAEARVLAVMADGHDYSKRAILAALGGADHTTLGAVLLRLRAAGMVEPTADWRFVARSNVRWRLTERGKAAAGVSG